MPNTPNRISFRLYDFVRVKMEQQKKKWKITLTNKLNDEKQTIKKLTPKETKALINFIFMRVSEKDVAAQNQRQKIINLINKIWNIE